MEPMSTVWIHLKTGGYYTVVCEGVEEATGEHVVIYRSLADDKVWVRPSLEYYDGRFVLMTADEVKRLVVR